MNSRTPILSFILSLLFIFFACSCLTAQNPTLTEKQRQEDIDYLNRRMRRLHPAYYAYTSREKMDSICAAAAKQTDNADVLRFRNTVRSILANTGCGHIAVKVPVGIPARDSLLYLPADVWICGNKLTLRSTAFTDTLLHSGDELLEINQLPADQLLKDLQAMVMSDGYNTTHKNYYLKQFFPYYHYSRYGLSRPYAVKVKRGGDTLSFLLNASLRPGELRREPSAVHDSTARIIAGPGVNLYRTSIDSLTLLLDVDNFLDGGQKKSYRRIFRHLRERGTRNLIIDLRDNGGGNVFRGNRFLGYFRKELVYGLDFCRMPNLIPFDPTLKMGFWNRITPFLFMLNPLQYPGRGGWHHYFPFVRKFRNHYNGNVYVICNGATFSMAGWVTSVLKYKCGAIVAGEESGGNVRASRGMNTVEIILPNSKISVSLNTYQMTYVRKIQDDGFGVKPDLNIVYSAEDYMSGNDLELEAIGNRIKSVKSE